MSIFNFQALSEKKPSAILSSIIQFAKSTFTDFQKDKIGQKAASLTYYTLFSLAPFLILIIFLGGLFLEKQNLQETILERLASTTGPQTRDMVAQIINQTQSGNNGLIFSILAGIGVLLGASGLISNFEEMVNSLWSIEENYL